MSLEFAVGLVSAFWLGILTSISPCPMATNIAAMAYIGRRVSNPRQVLWGGLLYTLGQTIVYVLLGLLLAGALVAKEEISARLHEYMNELLGPILIVVAMLLLGLIDVRIAAAGLSDTTQRRIDALGVWGALLLGVLFALSFCPVSAGLFFGSLLGIALKIRAPLAAPAAYGLGAALPVVAFALILAFSARAVGRTFQRLSQVEWWARRATGTLFLALGIYYALRFAFEMW